MVKQISKEELQQALEQAGKEQFLAWKDHPVTQLILAWVNQQRQDRMEMWAGGGFMAQTLEEVAMRNATVLGYMSAMNDILNIDYQELQGNTNE